MKISYKSLIERAFDWLPPVNSMEHTLGRWGPCFGILTKSPTPKDGSVGIRLLNGWSALNQIGLHQINSPHLTYFCFGARSSPSESKHSIHWNSGPYWSAEIKHGWKTRFPSTRVCRCLSLSLNRCLPREPFYNKCLLKLFSLLWNILVLYIIKQFVCCQRLYIARTEPCKATVYI